MLPRNTQLAGAEDGGANPYDLQTPPSKAVATDAGEMDELFPLEGE